MIGTIAKAAWFVVAWSVRIVFFITFGWMLTAGYLLLGLILSPFGMLFGGGGFSKRAETAWRIGLLKPDMSKY